MYEGYPEPVPKLSHWSQIDALGFALMRGHDVSAMLQTALRVQRSSLRFAPPLRHQAAFAFGLMCKMENLGEEHPRELPLEPRCFTIMMSFVMWPCIWQHCRICHLSIPGMSGHGRRQRFDSPLPPCKKRATCAGAGACARRRGSCLQPSGLPFPWRDRTRAIVYQRQLLPRQRPRRSRHIRTYGAAGYAPHGDGAFNPSARGSKHRAWMQSHGPAFLERADLGRELLWASRPKARPDARGNQPEAAHAGPFSEFAASEPVRQRAGHPCRHVQTPVICSSRNAGGAHERLGQRQHFCNGSVLSPASRAVPAFAALPPLAMCHLGFHKCPRCM